MQTTCSEAERRCSSSPLLPALHSRLSPFLFVLDGQLNHFDSFREQFNVGATSALQAWGRGYHRRNGHRKRNLCESVIAAMMSLNAEPRRPKDAAREAELKTPSGVGSSDPSIQY